ncbi:MAG: transcription termination factor NusA [Patescibacteria group bacterium]|nr:transcription termination factor NusA [Patescibacteria group bacterium]MCL5262195.1 transcription termination factor NusA [Patescibacteria group bacterium]
MDLKQLLIVIGQVAKEKGIEPEKIISVIEESIAAAYRKEYGKRGEVIKAKLDEKTGELAFWQVKEVVDENTVRVVTEEEAVEEQPAEPQEEEEPKLPRYNPERHIFVEEAKKVNPDVQVGENLEFSLEPKTDFGRIAAQAAKQVILQKLREAEKDMLLQEFKDKEGKVVSGIIHRFDRGNVYVEIGKALGIMFGNESIPGEHYRTNERMRFYVLSIQEDRRGQPGIILSRSHPRFINRLFELEVPEINDGTVEIKGVAREPGSRTKIAVASKAQGVDPVGSCVGQRGTRVMAVTNELGGQEKIDIIEWSEEPEKFVAASLSPAKVLSVEISLRREAKVLVAEDQLSLAIGKGGQNVRLAAKLTGMKIDVRSESRPEEVQEGGVAETEDEDTLPEVLEGDLKQDKIEETKIIPKFVGEED